MAEGKRMVTTVAKIAAVVLLLAYLATWIAGD